MDCHTARQALSAVLDGEPGEDGEHARCHARSCPACTDWYQRVARTDRALRVGPAASPGLDITERVLASVRLPRRPRLPRIARVVLAVVALAQLGIGFGSLFGLPGLTMGMPGMGGGTHLDHEEAAFNLAFGIALLVVAVNTRSARFQLPVLGGFLLVLGVTSGMDLADGVVGWARLATHAPIVLGVLLTAVLQLTQPADTGPGHRVGAVPRPAGDRLPRRWRSALSTPHDAASAPRYDTPPPAAHRTAA